MQGQVFTWLVAWALRCVCVHRLPSQQPNEASVQAARNSSGSRVLRVFPATTTWHVGVCILVSGCCLGGCSSPESVHLPTSQHHGGWLCGLVGLLRGQLQRPHSQLPCRALQRMAFCFVTHCTACATHGFLFCQCLFIHIRRLFAAGGSAMCQECQSHNCAYHTASCHAVQWEARLVVIVLVPQNLLFGPLLVCKVLLSVCPHHSSRLLKTYAAICVSTRPAAHAAQPAAMACSARPQGLL
jgi:hypothetical protein